MEVIDFLKENKELFQKPKNQIDWVKVYELASDDFKDNLGKFTEFWLNKDIHPENYLSEVPQKFLSNSSVRNFEIPINIKKIGDDAFGGCQSLENITISNSVTTISNFAFWNCDSLTSVTIPDSVTSIGDKAFAFCMSLTSVVIGDSVESIGYSMFWNCTSLTNVVIPNSVTSIGSDAFWNCGENLIISYKGTKRQFRTLAKGCFKNTYFTAHCIDGDIVKKKR